MTCGGFLRIENISKNFGGLTVLQNVSLTIERGARHALIGSNGAGKTTLFNIIGGEISPSNGRICLEGNNVTGLRPFEMCQKGVARTFQKNNLFWGLSVFENVRLAVQRHQGTLTNLFRSASAFQAVNQETECMLDKTGLKDFREEMVKDLPYGIQRQLEVAVALASKAKLMLLDEPTAGMSPVETNEIVRMVKNLSREITILVIEHDLSVVQDLADSVTVLHNGSKLAEGSFDKIKCNPRVSEVLLGLENEGVALDA